MRDIEFGWVIVAAMAGSSVGCGDDGSASSEAGTTGGGSSSGAVDTTGMGTTADPDSSTSAAESTGGEPPLTRIEQILQDLTIGMYECPDRVWPGDVIDNYRVRQVLLVSSEQNTAWMFNDQVAEGGDPPRITMGPADSLPPEWAAFFNVGQINAVPTLGISLDATAQINDEKIEAGKDLYIDFASELTFHEAFHFLSDQSDWNAGGGSRSIPYPEPWEPRYLRAELIAALRAHLEAGEDLGRGAFWRERLLAEFPDEMADIRSYDVTEGSAEYAAAISSALARLGCDATDEEIMAETIAHLDDGFLGTGYDGGREPYDLGVLAGLILRGEGVDGWEANQENGFPPDEQLLEGMQSVSQPDDPSLQEAVQAAVDERNVAVGMEIDPMLDALADPAFYRVVVSFNWIAGSFSLGGFYYLPDQTGEPEVMLRLSALLQPPSAVEIELIEETSLAAVDTPCALAAAPTIVLTLPAADVSVANGQATSTAATAKFTDLDVEVATDAEGLEWLCPVDAGGAGAPPPDDTPPFAEVGPQLHPVRGPTDEAGQGRPDQVIVVPDGVASPPK